MNVHQAVLENKEKTGITIHYVNNITMKGSLFFKSSKHRRLQNYGRNCAKVHELEHQYFPEVMGKLITNH